MSDTTTATATTTTDATSTSAAPSTPTLSQSTEASLLSGATTTTQSSTSGTPSTTTSVSPWSLSETGEFTEGWLDRLPDDFKDSKQILGQFKDPAAMAKTLVNQQRLLGKKADAVFIPGADAPPEEIAAFRAKLGVPESADKYAVKIEGVNVPLDEAGVKQFNELAHKSGLTPAQAQEAVKFYAGIEEQRAAQAAEAQKAEYAAANKALATAWGEKYETNKAVAIRMAQSVGLDPNSKGLSDPAVVIALERAARMIADDKIVSSDVTATMLAGKARAMDIATNEANPLHAKWLKGDKATHDLYMDLLQHG